MIRYTIIITILIFFFYSLTEMHNPLRFSLKISILAVITFFLTRLLTSSWFPIILIILILGGILVVFSILSALIPNEKIKKEKIKIFFFRATLGTLFTVVKFTQENVIKFNKSFIEETPVFFLVLILILFYFFSFIYFLRLGENRIRKFLCLN